MRFRVTLCWYGTTFIGCTIILIISTLFCWNNCDFTRCAEFCETQSDVYNKKRAAQQSWMTGGKYAEQNSRRTITTSLVVLILSSPANMEQRDTIRQTWLKDHFKKTSVLHYFAIGSGRLDSEERVTLKSEQDRFGDLLLLKSVNDSYGSLTLKLLKSVCWLSDNIDFQFLLKVDDDSFVRLDVVLDELLSIKNKARLYWGFFNGCAQVKQYGRWQEPDWNLCDYYLPYALGGGYVISSDLAQFVSQNSEYFKLYKSEDVSMGTWLAPLDINRIHDPRFDTEYKSRGCFNSYLVTHKQSVQQMRNKYWLLKERGYMCNDEIQTRYSYIYNWHVPPSQCCVRNDSSIP